MPEQMILDGAVVPARFVLRESPAPGEVPPADSAIPLAAWLGLRESGFDLQGVGVIVEGQDDLTPLEPHLPEVAVVVLRIPKFTDGRAYSHARRLRAAWGYRGVVLASGDVLRDQLVYLARAGVNAFYMREDQDLRASLGAFSLFSAFYQPS